MIVDATDNAQTRYLINDYAVKHRLAWVYGGAVATGGRAAAFVPGKTACLRCVFREPPGPGEVATCDTAGVLGPVTAGVAALQAMLAIRLIVEPQNVPAEMTAAEYWPAGGKAPVFRTLDLSEPDPDCPACGANRLTFLDAPTPGLVALCGRDAVQVSSDRPVELDTVADRLAGAAAVTRTRFFVRWEAEGRVMTLFPDGRLLVQGTTDPGIARGVYARWVGV